MSASRRAHRQDGSRARYTNGEKAPTLQRPCVSECVLLRRVVEKGECRVGRVCEWMRQMNLALYRGMFGGGRGKRVTRDGLQVDGRKQERPTSNSSRAGTRSIATLVHAEWRKRQGRSSEAARPRLDQLAPWTWIARHHLWDDREPPLGWVRAS